MVVSGHPEGGGVVYSAGSRCWIFDAATERRSSEISLSDFAAGNVISSVATQSKLLVTVESGASRSAYVFDRGSAPFVCGVGVNGYE